MHNGHKGLIIGHHTLLHVCPPVTYSLSSPPSPSFSTSVSSNSSSCRGQTRSRQLMWRMRTLALASYWPVADRNVWEKIKIEKIKVGPKLAPISKWVAIYLLQEPHHPWQKMTPDPANQSKKKNRHYINKQKHNSILNIFPDYSTILLNFFIILH